MIFDAEIERGSVWIITCGHWSIYRFRASSPRNNGGQHDKFI
jgi:hypothetical protein